MNAFANLPQIRLEIERTKRTGCRVAVPAAGWGSLASPSSPPPLN